MPAAAPSAWRSTATVPCWSPTMWATWSGASDAPTERRSAGDDTFQFSTSASTLLPPVDLTLSVLDLAPILQGGTAAEAFRHSRQLAQHAEQLGYPRVVLGG